MDPAVAGDYAAGRCGLTDVARRWGMSRPEARRALTGAGVAVRGVGRPLGASVFAAALTEAYLRREYLEGGRSVRELATEVGCTDKTVTRYLRCHGIPRREGPPLGLDREQLSRWFVDEGRGIAEIAGRAGCSARAVRTLLARWDVRRTVAPMSTAALRDAYVGQGRSTTDIAAQLGCAPATVARRLRSAGIPLRRPGGAHLPRARWPEAGIRPGLLPADR